ncbi:hypothetical protein LUZ60_017698 [Juncus effusus]|nr:hypothetical protein LUZ60_017698 [Juncus effusus]
MASVCQVINSNWDLSPLLLSNNLIISDQAARLLTILNSTTLSSASDNPKWRWTSDGLYSANSSYKFFFKTNRKSYWNAKVWKIKIPMKIRFFLWLLGLNRLPTQHNLVRKGWSSISTCTLCSGGLMESTVHLFLHCTYSMRFWNQLSAPSLPADDSPISFWLRVRLTKLTITEKKFWDTQWAAGCWMLWKQRNQRVFNNKKAPPSVTCCLAIQEARRWRDNG